MSESKGNKGGTPDEPDAPYCGCADWMDEAAGAIPPVKGMG